jgi:hypothetical protein
MVDHYIENVYKMNENLVVSIVNKNGFVKAVNRVFRFVSIGQDYGIVGYIEKYNYSEHILVLLEMGSVQNLDLQTF